MPLVQGLRLTTGDDGQAEIEFEDGSLVRMTPNSTLSLDNLSVDGSGNFQTQLALVRGLIYAELRAASKYSYRLYAGRRRGLAGGECDGSDRSGRASGEDRGA